ncbi:HotDog domain-containing protein [Sporodiniella umbellata]|nr:HotDog domain-containing protein [Sporodiniella umbellata]
MSKELNRPLGSRGVFGGQSIHAYFILAGRADTPVIYHVQRIRDGRSFATRIVKATQKGKNIFICSCSFAKPEEGIVLSHQSTMPNVSGPESLPNDLEVLENAYQNTKEHSQRFLKRLEARRNYAGVIENRNVYQETAENVVLGNVEPRQGDQRWFKTRERLGDDFKLHACCIAYASDSGLLNVAAVAHGMTYSSESVGMMTSLDHTIWFHTPTRADDWLLYDKTSPQSDQGRGTAIGKIYNRQGVLVATTAQEGVVRLSALEKEKRQTRL